MHRNANKKDKIPRAVKLDLWRNSRNGGANGGASKPKTASASSSSSSHAPNSTNSAHATANTARVLKPTTSHNTNSSGHQSVTNKQRAPGTPPRKTGAAAVDHLQHLKERLQNSASKRKAYKENVVEAARQEAIKRRKLELSTVKKRPAALNRASKIKKRNLYNTVASEVDLALELIQADDFTGALRSLETFCDQVPEAQDTGLYWVTLAHATEFANHGNQLGEQAASASASALSSSTAMATGGAREALAVLDHALAHLSRDLDECIQVNSCRTALLKKYPDVENPLPLLSLPTNSSTPAEQPVAAATSASPKPFHVQADQESGSLNRNGDNLRGEEEEGEELCAPDMPGDDEDDVSISQTKEFQEKEEQEKGKEEEEDEEEEEEGDDDDTIEVATGLSTVERIRNNPMSRLGSALRNNSFDSSNKKKMKKHNNSNGATTRSGTKRSNTQAQPSSSSSSTSSSGATLQGSYVTLGLVRLRKNARDELGVPKAATPQRRSARVARVIRSGTMASAGACAEEDETEEEELRQEQEDDVLRQANYAYQPNPLVAMYDSEAAAVLHSPALSRSGVQRRIGFE